MITILGEHISLVRPTLVKRSVVPASVWRTPRTRARRVALSWSEKESIASSMGYRFVQIINKDDGGRR